MNYLNPLLSISWQELALYASSLILLIIGLRLLRKRRTKPVRLLGFWHEDPEVLKDYCVKAAKNREGERRDF